MTDASSVPLSAAALPLARASSASPRWLATLAVVGVAAGIGGAVAIMTASAPHPAAPAPTHAAAPVVQGHVMAHGAMQGHHAPPAASTPEPKLTGVALQRETVMQQILEARAERDGNESRRGLLLQQRAQAEYALAGMTPSDPRRMALARDLAALRKGVAEASAAAGRAAARAGALESRMAALSATAAR